MCLSLSATHRDMHSHPVLSVSLVAWRDAPSRVLFGSHAAGSRRSTLTDKGTVSLLTQIQVLRNPGTAGMIQIKTRIDNVKNLEAYVPIFTIGRCTLVGFVCTLDLNLSAANRVSPLAYCPSRFFSDIRPLLLQFGPFLLSPESRLRPFRLLYHMDY